MQYPVGNEAFMTPRVVTPQMYNIYAGRTDGVNDDSDAIIWAITQALAMGNGGVYLGSGVYRITKPLGGLITRALAIWGDGISNCWIVVDPAMSGDVLAFSNTWYGTDVVTMPDGSTSTGHPVTAVTWPNNTARKSGVTLHGFSIIGDRRTSQTQNGIIFYDRNDTVKMSHVEVQCIKGIGLCLSGIPSNPASNAASVLRESEISSVQLRWCGDMATARPALVLNSTDKGSASYDDACNYNRLRDIKVIFCEGTGFQTNTYNVNSNNSSNNEIEITVDSPVMPPVAFARAANGATSITNGVMTVAAGGLAEGQFAAAQYICNAAVPPGTYISSVLSEAGGGGQYQLAHRTLDLSDFSKTSGELFDVRSQVPLIQIGGGHFGDRWRITINARNVLSSGCCGIEFNQNPLDVNGAKTGTCTLELSNGPLPLVMLFTVISSLHVDWTLRSVIATDPPTPQTAIAALTINQSVTVNTYGEYIASRLSIGGGGTALTRLHVYPGGERIVETLPPAIKYPNALLVQRSDHHQYVSDGSSWTQVT
jgi:hypothetical protein